MTLLVLAPTGEAYVDRLFTRADGSTFEADKRPTMGEITLAATGAIPTEGLLIEVAKLGDRLLGGSPIELPGFTFTDVVIRGPGVTWVGATFSENLVITRVDALEVVGPYAYGAGAEYFSAYYAESGDVLASFKKVIRTHPFCGGGPDSF